MVAPAKNFLGTGLYSVHEAALYARVSVPTMSRWLFGTTAADSVIPPEYGKDGRRVSFLDFVQTLAIREIRLQEKVSLQKIRQAINYAKDAFGFDYPFAREHFTYLWGDEIVIRPSHDEFVEATGKHKGQRLFTFVETYLGDLTFNIDGLANRYRIYRSHHDDPVAITMDPEFRFGEPLLPSGYSAVTIWEAIRAEGSIPRAARSYGIPAAEVEAAYQFVVDRLGATPG